MDRGIVQDMGMHTRPQHLEQLLLRCGMWQRGQKGNNAMRKTTDKTALLSNVRQVQHQQNICWLTEEDGRHSRGM